MEMYTTVYCSFFLNKTLKCYPGSKKESLQT